MRVLVLVPSLTDLVGGIQTYAQALVEALASLGQVAGWKIEVLALHDKTRGEHRGSVFPGIAHRGFGGGKLGFSLAAISASRHADLVLVAHVNFSPLLHVIRWVAPRARCRVSAHGIEVWRPLGRLVTSALLYAGEVWPVSDYTRRRLIEENPGLRDLRFGYLPNTLGPSYPSTRAESTSAELGVAGKKVLLAVSRLSSLERYKNVDKVLKALPEVLKRVPNAFLVVVGPGDDRPRLEAITRESGVEGQVRFTGRVTEEELQSYLAACDLFVLPSTGEGFGIVYLEAMFHAKACIGARAGGVPEVVEDGVTGLLVEPDVHTLADAMARLMTQDAQRTQMGLAGRKRLDERFSASAFRHRLAELVDSAF